MKQLITFLFVTFSISLFSQTNTWFTDGQQWHYTHNTSFDSGYEKLTVVGDTIINNLTCKKLEAERVTQPSFSSGSFTGISYYCSYEQNDSVYYKSNLNNEFTLIYDFNMQVGDKLMFSQDLTTVDPPDSLGYEIDSIGIMDINGTALRFQKINIILGNNGNYEILGQSLILEKIGMTPLNSSTVQNSYFNLTHALAGMALFEKAWQFRCYSDENTNYQPNGDWCDRLPYGNWLNPEASWCHMSSHFTGYSERNIRLAGQELFEDYNPPILWKAISETRTLDFNNVYTSLDSFYLYENDGHLYHVSLDLAESEELFNLNWQENDTIQVPSETCDESYMIVDSIRNVLVDGIELRRLYCMPHLYVEGYLNTDVSTIEITERLGSIDLLGLDPYFHCITDAPGSVFLQYADHEINYIESGVEGCFSIEVSNNNIIKNSDISIFPNPTSSSINIASDEKIIQINITDYSGKLIKTINNNFNKIQ